MVNGADVMAIDASKARQLALIASLGLAIPETRVVHRAADVEAAAATLSFPLVVKANIGGSGAGIVKFDNMAELRWAVGEGELPKSVDGVLLVQDYVPARGGTITRIETLDRNYLYAIEIAGGGAFDLCPADACVADSNIKMVSVEPAPDADRRGRADRRRDEPRRRRDRGDDRRPRRDARASTTSTPCPISSRSRWTCSAGTRTTG